MPDMIRDKVPVYEHINVRTIIVEREIYRLMKEWLSFEEANALANTIDPVKRENYIKDFQEQWMIIGNIFYKQVSGSYDKKVKELPSLVVS